MKSPPPPFHGVVTLGYVAYHALARMANLRKSCVIQLYAGQSSDVQSISPEVMPSFREEIDRGVVVDNLWQGLLRKLDRLDPSYKE